MIKGESAEIEEKNRLIGRIAASDLFRKSPRLRDFLIYAADCTLNNRLLDVREQVIAERVFGRRPEFNGGQDSIVRAEARNLRKRLEAYFESEGRDEPIIVTMPRGGYALAFEVRRAVRESEAAPAATEPELLLPEPEAPAVSAPTPAHATTYRRLSIAMALLAAFAFGLAFYWRSADATLRNQLGIQKPTLPFSALFSDSQDSLIVTSDTGLVQISLLARRRISLDDYIARSYPAIPNLQPPDLVRNWNIYEFTDGREMAVAGLILRNNIQFAQHIALRSGHQVQLPDFKDHSVVLIGSPISNPWAQLYEEKLNFPCDLASDSRITFRNRTPKPGESPSYPSPDDIAHNRTYARLVFLPRTSEATATLLIAGTTAESSQAGGEFIADRTRLGNTLRSMGIDPDGPAHYFEILIRSNNFIGGAMLPEVVAWRSKASAEK